MTNSFKDAEFCVPENTQLCDPHGWLVCVSVAINEHGVAVRDTKDPEKATQVYTHDEWRAFTEAVKKGQFDV